MNNKPFFTYINIDFTNRYNVIWGYKCNHDYVFAFVITLFKFVKTNFFMKDRLAILIREEELTSGRLAEILDVQPSSISHLLSGRNKPGFDFISKLIQRFPNVNPKWIILGEEPMYIDLAKNTIVEEKKYYTDMATKASEVGSEFSDYDLFSADKKNDSGISFEVDGDIKAPIPTETKNYVTKNIPEKNIERIILFFDDGSFKEYTN